MESQRRKRPVEKVEEGVKTGEGARVAGEEEEEGGKDVKEGNRKNDSVA